MHIEDPRVIRLVYLAAVAEIPLAEYIGTRGDGEYLVLDARARCIGRVILDDDGKPQVEAFKLEPGSLPN